MAVSAKVQCEIFLKRIEKRLDNGLDAMAVEFAEALFQELSSKAGIVVDGRKVGSEPGEVPALFAGWFTKALVTPKIENHESKVGLNMEMASDVYRLLIRGNKHIQPRDGPKELFDVHKPFLVEAFRKGFCEEPDISPAPEGVGDF